MFTVTDPSLPRLSLEARRRNLQVRPTGDSCFAVSSHSNPGWWYSVRLSGDESTCSCRATGPCTHAAIALYESDFGFYRQVRDAETDERFDLLVRIRTGQLSKGEKRRVKKYGVEVKARLKAFLESMPVPF